MYIIHLHLHVVFLSSKIWENRNFNCHTFKIPFESVGRMEGMKVKVVLKVKLAYFGTYLWQTIWNHAKNQWKSPNFQIQCFYNRTSGALCWKHLKNTKTRETKTQITQTLKRYDLSRVVPCERARPEHSKNVVVFEIWMF